MSDIRSCFVLQNELIIKVSVNIVDKYVIAVDIGTQSLRVCMLNQRGENIDYVESKYKKSFYTPSSISAEVDCDFYMDYFVNSIKQLVSRQGEKLSSVIAVSVVTIRDTIVFLKKTSLNGEKEQYKPVYNIIHWADGRSASEKFCSFPLWMTVALKLIGKYNSVKRIATMGRTNWMRENRPDVWKETTTVTLLSSYINYRLTGNLVETQSCLLGHLPFNTKKGKWDKKGSLHDKVFPDVTDKLPPLIRQDSPVGYITNEIADITGLPSGIPVYSPGTDKALEQIGQGAIHETDVSVSLGSAASIELMTDRYFESEPFIPAFRSAIYGKYSPDYQVYRGYWMLNWFAHQFAFESEWEEAGKKGSNIERLLDSMLDETPVCNDGLYMIPFWGEGISSVGARGAFIGFNDSHTRANIYRAIVEGINYELYDGYIKMKKRGRIKKSTDLYISGGGMNSDKICQMVADMFNLPTHRGEFVDASILGAGIAAFVYEGVYPSFENAVSKMVREESVFIPQKECHSLYLGFYNKIYKGSLKKLYDRFLTINKAEKK